MKKPKSQEEGIRFDGKQAVADMLNVMDQKTSEKILTNVAKEDPALAIEIGKKMFTFQHLRKLSPLSAQKFLRQLSPKKLAMALRGMDEEFLKFIAAHMSKAAVQLIQDEMQAMGKQRISDVEEARVEIINKLKEEIQKGSLTTERDSSR